MQNREIKFRVWNKETNSFLKRYDEKWNVIGLYIIGIWNNLFSYSDRYKEDLLVFQQYTGLKDKTGREIYEGDIIKFKNHPISSIRKKSPMLVEWNRGFFNCWDSLIIDLEIIGNIFENKDLLD